MPPPSSSPQPEKKEPPAKGAGGDQAAGPGERGGDGEGSSDEGEGNLVIDEKNEKGAAKRKAEDSLEVRNR